MSAFDKTRSTVLRGDKHYLKLPKMKNDVCVGVGYIPVPDPAENAETQLEFLVETYGDKTVVAQCIEKLCITARQKVANRAANKSVDVIAVQQQWQDEVGLETYIETVKNGGAAEVAKAALQWWKETGGKDVPEFVFTGSDFK